MCGICGIVHTDTAEPVDATILETMNDALRHRGPDDSGLWTEGPAGLAARRLSILDLENGHQPMLNEDGSLVLVFNGEIYNFQELRAELEAKGYRFRTQCDTEVVLKACEAYGDDAVQRFNGMFAFAVYDTKRRRLFLARDRLGIKPLHYAFRDGVFAFASELDSLLRSRAVTGTLNPAALDAYFTYLYVPEPDCVFEGVHKLGPGETLVLENGRIATQAYWRPEFKPDPSWTLDSAAEAYAELLKDAVRLRRISDVPLGAFLSGGMDSSSVVAFLSSVSDAPVKTFTIGFDDPQANEIPYARIAAKHFAPKDFATSHVEEIMKPNLVEMAPQLVRHFGEPFADSSAIPTWLVAKLARDHVTVVLSGDGGDELFAGYTWLHMNRKVAQYRRIPSLLRTLVDTALRLAPSSPRLAKLRRFSHDSFLSAYESFRRRQTCFSAESRAAIYTGELGDRVASSAVDRFQEHADAAATLSEDDWMLRQDLRMYLPGDILTKVDRMTMAVSLEARVPLLDHRLVEFAATVPFELKLKANISKRLAKHALRGVLPAELLEQRKRGFSIPIHRWFREDLREHFRDAVLSPDAASPAFLNVAAIQTLFDAHVAGREDYGHHLWCLLMFEHWLRYARTIPNLNVTL